MPPRRKFGPYLYLDLSDSKVYNRLTKKQKYYIEKQESIYREKLIVSKSEVFDNKSDVIKAGMIQHQQDVLSGAAYRKAQSIFYENYITGLKVRGQAGLANLLEYLISTHKGERYRDALYVDLPQLDVFYADKRSMTGSDSKDKQVLGDNPSTYSDVESELKIRAKQARIPSYVVDYIMKTPFTDGDKPSNYSLEELRYLAKKK